MALSPKQHRVAAEIDAKAAKLLKQGGDEALLAGMLPLMHRFKPMLDASKPGDLDQLCAIYTDFARFVRLLESMSLAIEDGRIRL